MLTTSWTSWRRPTSTRTSSASWPHRLGQQYELITRDDRLDAVAKDIVDHFLGRGFPGKGMVVSIDKVTAVRTYEKVQRFWDERLEQDLADTGLGDPRRRAA